MRASAAITVALILCFGLLLISATPEKTADPSIEAACLNNLGAAYMNQQLFEKGLKAFEQASSADPKLVIARVNQGIALVNLQRVDAATKILQDAIKADPKDAYAWYNLGMLYKNSGDPQAAIDAFKKVTDIDPDDADSWYMLGSAYLQAKQFPQAEDAFQHALRINPLHASAEFGFSRALQESGNMPQARTHLVRFQYITKNKLGAPMSLAYGEQGKYSRAEESPAITLKPPPEVHVQFVDVSEKAGLGGSHGASKALGSGLGPGACFVDYDSDGLPDLFLPDAGNGMALYHNLGKGRLDDVTINAGFNPKLKAASCTTGDYDNDGAADLVVGFTGTHGVLLFHNEKNGTFKNVTAESGVKFVPDAQAGPVEPGLLFIDYDHDGDLDLYITADTSLPMWSEQVPVAEARPLNRMWRNNGDGTFTDVTDAVGLAASVHSAFAIGTDFNNDRAIDLLITGSQAQTTLVENPREGAFAAQQPWSPSVAESTMGVAVLDFDHDGWMDQAFAHWGVPALSLWKNEQGTKLQRVPLPELNWAHAYGIAALDYDNDGWIDLAAVGETKDGKGEIKLFRNLGADGFKDVTADVGLDKIQLKNPRALITGDYDADGATDLLITQNHAPAVLLRNEGANKNHWLRLSL
ncbi:MAG TPA: FG-GAP-like repeat-containing protein, partial [Terriglobales bacterium]|nr:FG-GAP-like repeat-containing protein [Terriglobales bacterium]